MTDPSRADDTARIEAENSRLHWETEKLRLEAEALRQPKYFSLKTAIALATALVAFLSAGFTYQLNQVKAERAGLQAARAQDEFGRLEQAKMALAEDIDAMQTENDRISRQLVELRRELEGAEARIRAAVANTDSAATRQALIEARDSVATLRATTSETEADGLQRTERHCQVDERSA